MRTRFEFTSVEDARRIVDGAMELLEVVGMRFGAGDALEALGEAGAKVDREAGVARIPRELVERAIAQCPREIVLGGATPEDDCLLTEGVPHFLNSGTPTTILDFRTGEAPRGRRRRPARGDARSSTRRPRRASSGRSSRPGTSRPSGARSRSSPSCSRHDQAHPARGRRSLRRSTSSCAWPRSTGGDLRERPRVSVVCCTASPLSAHSELLDASTDLAALGIPVLVLPMPIAGGTAPLTVAATATMNVAEFFGAATAMQLRAPGAPLILGAAPGLLDMKQTTFSFAAPEAALASAVCVEVGHGLGLACMAPSQSTDAKHPGIQAAYEKMLKGFTVAATRPDLMTGIGMLHAANLRLAAADRHRRRDGAGDPAHPRRPRGVGGDPPRRDDGAHGLRRGTTCSRRTRAAGCARARSSRRLVADRQSYEHWAAAGKDELAVATDRVLEILAAAEERGPLLDAAQLAELEACVAAGAAAAQA